MAAQHTWTVERVFLNKFSIEEAIEKIVTNYIITNLEREEMSDTEIERGD